MFYFAAASYAEMARRVAPERAAAGFLRAGDPAFAPALRTLSPAGGAARAQTSARACADAVAPVNIAGLCEPGRGTGTPPTPPTPSPARRNSVLRQRTWPPRWRRWDFELQGGLETAPSPSLKAATDYFRVIS